MTDSEPDQERRRRRPAVSCSFCRRRKIKCNREVPCSNCVRSSIAANCVYDKFPTPSRTQAQQNELRQAPCQRQNHQLPIGAASERDASLTPGIPICPVSPSLNDSMPLSLTSLYNTPNTDPTSDAESMKRRIKELEDQLSVATRSSVPSTARPHPALSPANSIISNKKQKSSLAGTFHVHKESRPFGQGHPVAVTYGVLHKTRLLGQSHWINAVTGYHDFFEIIEPCIQEGSKAAVAIHKCKTLGKLIKTRRAPSWPSPLTWPDLPLREIADGLVDCYIQTIETIYRVLHIPTFRKSYEAIWASTGKPDIEFLVQLKLIFAIGAATYDDQFSLRSSAVRWVYEAQTWISEPEFKSRLTIKSLQTEILLLLAREMAAIGGRLIWVSAGSLFRNAVYMGLHKDPSFLPKKTTFAAEMRRRIWNTILELMLLSSMDSGGPPLISLTDWDTEPPANFDDDELLITDAIPRPETEFSHTSLAIIFRKTLPLRLSIVKSLNNVSTPITLEGAIRLDSELRSSYKTMCQDIKRFDSTNGLLPSQFGINILNVIMLRYLSSLHIPFFVPALQGPAYSFSRKVVLETSLKLWYLLYPLGSTSESQPQKGSAATDQHYLQRLTICGSGFLRTIALQSGFIIAMELKTQLQEETSLGPVTLRPDFLHALNDTKTWNMRCIEAGEVNVKGYLFICIGIAYLDAVRQGYSGEKLAASIVGAAEQAIEECVVVLEKMSAQDQNEPDELRKTSLATPPDLMEDWDFMMTNAQYNFGDALGWAFNYDNSQESSLW
ncbi:b6defd70-ee44-4bf1-b228-2ee1e86260f7 [Sclerotinia trifoliorum]|uniref:B6defd70-ee44-4bf1-b228-2ee1e86260f7 n=1 Tax=Sclerotinia trifoliorum TaxID=28548 RepID=A0A8H2ZXG7_9HELO|nr:b6defd70-ee44-4bf1-b228-2ee1e86260f7 [Sclerotinia trifoliorum]